MATLLSLSEEEYIPPYGSQQHTLVRIIIQQSGEGEGRKRAVGRATSAAAGGGAALLAIGGSLLVLSIVLLRGEVGGGTL